MSTSEKKMKIGLVLREQVCVDNAYDALQACTTSEERKITNAFIANIVGHDNYAIVPYFLKHADLNVGRFCSSFEHPSSNMLSRAVRALLVGLWYYDIDMKKSGPCIIYKYAKKHCIAKMVPLICAFVENDVLPIGIEDKKQFVRALDGGGGCAALTNEGLIVATHLMQNAQNKDAIAAYMDRSNRQSPDDMIPFRFLALWVQTEERLIVSRLISLAERDGYEVGAYVFDGIHVHSHTGVPPVDKWSAELGYEFVIKTMPTCAHEQTHEDIFDKRYLCPCPALLPYIEMKRRFEQRVFRISCSENVLVLMDDKTYAFKTHSQLTHAFSNIACSDMTHAFVPVWLKDHTAKTYKSVVFAPPPKVVEADDKNMWSGFAHCNVIDKKVGDDDDDDKDVQFYLSYVRTLLESEQESEYFLRFVAHMIQFPGCKPKVALLLFGAQGTGKNMLLAPIEHLLGKQNCVSASQAREHIWGKFNSCIAYKILVIINELGEADSNGCIDYIKDYITCDRHIINEKCKAQYSFESFERYIITTNNPTPLQLTNDDRRWVVFEVTSAFLGKQEVFDRLAILMTSPNFLARLHAYFASRPGVVASDFMNGNDRPLTARYKEMVRDSTPPFTKWWTEYVAANTGTKDVLIKDLYMDFVKFASGNEEDTDMKQIGNITSFSRHMSAALPANTPHFRMHACRGRRINFDFLKNK